MTTHDDVIRSLNQTVSDCFGGSDILTKFSQFHHCIVTLFVCVQCCMMGLTHSFEDIAIDSIPYFRGRKTLQKNSGMHIFLEAPNQLHFT